MKPPLSKDDSDDNLDMGLSPVDYKMVKRKRNDEGSPKSYFEQRPR